MIALKGITRTYKTDEIETTALSNIDLRIAAGELVAITGPSGCGKSTLLNIIGLIDRPDEGSYLFNGNSVIEQSERALANIRKDNIGFIFQSFNLVSELSIYENIELPLMYTKAGSSERKHRVKQLMDLMKLSHRKDHYPRQLSGGQQQRVAVARAIVNNPRLILADEPTGNLDSKHGDEVMDLLIDLNEKGTTVVIVTHSLEYARLCKRTINVLDGRIVAEHAKQSFHA